MCVSIHVRPLQVTSSLMSTMRDSSRDYSLAQTYDGDHTMGQEERGRPA